MGHLDRLDESGREDLLRVICLAFRNGLVVKKIRLRLGQMACPQIFDSSTENP